MAITTYSGLIAAIPSHLFNNTLLTPSVCADFVAMVEAEFNRENRGRMMTAKATAVIDNEYAAIPDGWLGEISFRLETTGRAKLQFLYPAAFDQRIDDYTETGQPQYYTIIGEEFRFLPIPADSYTAQLVYWQAVPALNDGTETNWLLDKHPDAYLYGCLMHGAGFLKDEADRAKYEGWFTAIISSIEKSDRNEAMGGTLQVNPGGIVV